MYSSLDSNTVTANKSGTAYSGPTFIFNGSKEAQFENYGSFLLNNKKGAFVRGTEKLG